MFNKVRSDTHAALHAGFNGTKTLFAHLTQFSLLSEDGVSHAGMSNLCQCLGFCLYFTSTIYVLCHIIDKKRVTESKAARRSEFFSGRSLLTPAFDGYAPLQSSCYYMYHHVCHSKLYVLPTECIYVFSKFLKVGKTVIISLCIIQLVFL